MEEYFRRLYDKYALNSSSKKQQEGEVMKNLKENQKVAGRLAGIAVMLFLILIIVPAGTVMFVISGLWSALDRFLLKFER